MTSKDKLKSVYSMALEGSAGTYIGALAYDALNLQRATGSLVLFNHNGRRYRARLCWDEVDANGVPVLAQAQDPKDTQRLDALESVAFLHGVARQLHKGLTVREVIDATLAEQAQKGKG